MRVKFGDFVELFDVKDRENWLFGLQVDEVGVWKGIIGKHELSLLTPREVAGVMEFMETTRTTPLLSFPATTQEVDEFLVSFDLSREEFHEYDDWVSGAPIKLSFHEQLMEHGYARHNGVMFLTTSTAAEWIAWSTPNDGEVFSVVWDAATSITDMIVNYVKAGDVVQHDRRSLGELSRGSYFEDALFNEADFRSLVKAKYSSVNLIPLERLVIYLAFKGEDASRKDSPMNEAFDSEPPQEPFNVEEDQAIEGTDIANNKKPNAGTGKGQQQLSECWPEYVLWSKSNKRSLSDRALLDFLCTGKSKTYPQAKEESNLRKSKVYWIIRLDLALEPISWKTLTRFVDDKLIK